MSYFQDDIALGITVPTKIQYQATVSNFNETELKSKLSELDKDFYFKLDDDGDAEIIFNSYDMHSNEIEAKLGCEILAIKQQEID